jgi:hypothetical protein
MPEPFNADELAAELAAEQDKTSDAATPPPQQQGSLSVHTCPLIAPQTGQEISIALFFACVIVLIFAMVIFSSMLTRWERKCCGLGSCARRGVNWRVQGYAKWYTSFLRPTSQDGRLAPAQRPARYRPGGPRQ